MADAVQQTRQRRTQAERRDESERGLVRAAIGVVSEEGVSAATFEAIARRGGYSRGLVGQRFGSKLGLIEAVIAYLHDERQGVAADHCLDALPGLEALLGFVDLYLRRLAELGEMQAYFRLLSWAVAEWIEPRLDARSRRRVASSRGRALRALRAAASIEPPRELIRSAGLPPACEARALLDGMVRELAIGVRLTRAARR